MDNAYVVAGSRTAVGKANRGTLANFRPDDMAAESIKETVKRSGVPAEKVEDVVLGCSIPEQSQGMNVARISALRAGLPDQISAATVNRFCASGLEAIAIAASKVEAGIMNCAIAGGTETMSLVHMPGAKMSPNPWLTEHKPEVYINMGNAGDNVAKEYGYARAELDEFALGSNLKAVAAIDAGKFKDEIVPLDVPYGPAGPTVFDTDEGPRRETTLEGLASLKPAFNASPKEGFHTAGNSSQMSDGAATVMIMSENAAKEHGATPLAKFRSYSVAADSPAYLGPAQLVAIPKACELAGIKVEDVDLFEINEAFASVALHVMKNLNLDPEKVNVNGGAIALGHPLGCTGGKLSVQIINELKRRGGKYGVVTMCVGGGMGAAGVYELCD